MATSTSARRAVSMAGALIFLLAACAPFSRPEPTVDDLVGTWANGDTVLILEADMSFTLTGAPAYTAIGEGDTWPEGPSPTREDRGGWGLPAGLGSVSLGGDKLFIEYRGSEVVLMWGLDLGSGDPRCYELIREGSTLAPRGPEDCSIRS